MHETEQPPGRLKSGVTAQDLADIINSRSLAEQQESDDNC